MFNGGTYSRAIACCGHLTSHQNVLICTRRIKKRSTRKNNSRSEILQRSEISLVTGHGCL